MKVSKPTAKIGINWLAPQSTTGDVEQIAKSTMEIPTHNIPPYTLKPVLVSYVRPDDDIDKMQSDIKALSNEIEALRYEINLSTLSFLIVSLTFCIALILKFTGVI